MKAAKPGQVSRSEHSVPASQALQLIELLEFWRIGPSELLGPLGLTEQQLEPPDARLPVSTLDALLRRARTLTSEPALGVFMGLRRRVSMYGFLGFAAMTASSLREALELGVKFSATVSGAIKLRLDVENELAALRIEECSDAGDVRDIVLLALVIGLEQIGKALTGRTIPGTAHFAMPRPSYCARFPELFANTRFDQPETQLEFDAAYLDLPLVAPDRVGLRLARQQCERLLCDLGLDGALVDRVRSLIAGPDGFRSLEEVATSLHMSARTLKRRLAAQGSSFSTLTDQERCNRARILLRSTRLSLEDIAERLGYSTVPNFTRAFRRWTHQTPAAYRRAQQQPNARVEAPQPRVPNTERRAAP